MGLRFRRRVRIFPGFWLNLSKRGGSLSAAAIDTVNIGKGGHQATISAIGTGAHIVPGAASSAILEAPRTFRDVPSNQLQ